LWRRKLSGIDGDGRTVAMNEFFSVDDVATVSENNRNYNYLKLKFLLMGTIGKGFMGGFKGKLGSAVGATWKGL
jgi:hypothetical protein